MSLMRDPSPSMRGYPTRLSSALRRAEWRAVATGARFLAERAKRTGFEQQLGPLNPYERRIVHLTVAEDPTVASHSVGDAFSKVVIISARKSS